MLPIDNLFLFPPWQAHAAELGVTLPHNPLIGDAILQNYSWKRFAADSYASGRLPLWNPYILGGQPFLAGAQNGSLYPFGILFYALPLPQAYAAFLGLHVWLAAMFAYRLARLLAADRLGGLVAGVTFAFCGFLVVSFVWPMVVSTAIWLPALLALIELAFRRRPLSALIVAAGAVVVAMQFLAGHLEMSLYLLLTAGLYTTLRVAGRFCSERHARAFVPGLATLAMVALGAALASVQLVPFGEAIQANVRGGWSDYRETVDYALPRERWIAFVAPDYFGNPTHHTYLDLLDGGIRSVAHVRPNGEPRTDTEWGSKNYVEGSAYVGILPLLLAPLGLLARPTAGGRALGIVTLISLLLAFGTPLYALLYYGIPGVNQLHTPFRWVYPLSLCLAILAGLGASAALRTGAPAFRLGEPDTPPQVPQRWGTWGGVLCVDGSRWAARLGLAALVVGSSLVATLLLSLLFRDAALDAAERALRRWPELRGGFDEGRVLFSYQIANLFGTALLLVTSGLVLWSASRRRGATIAVAAVALIVGDLFSFGIGFNTVASTDALELVPSSIRSVMAHPEPFRVVTYGEDDTLPANTGMLFGLQDVRGYDTILLRDYVAYMNLIEPQRGIQYSKVAKLFDERSLASPLLDLLNARYVLTTRTVGLPDYALVDERDGVRVYRNERALPRAFVVQGVEPAADHDDALRLIAQRTFDPRQSVVLEGWDGTARPIDGSFLPAVVVEYGGDRVRVRALAPNGGFLVLGDTFFDGWQVRVDGADRPILRANALFRAAELEPGEHDVLFEYRPASLRVGAALSLVGAIVLGLLLGLSLPRRSERPADVPGGTAGRVLRNSAVPMATGLFNKVVDTAFAVVMIRVLQAEGVGSYTFAGVLIGYLDVVVGFGLGTLLTREVARDPSLAGRFLANALALRAGLWLVAAGAVALVVGPGEQLFGITPPLALTLWLLLFGLTPAILSGALSALFAARERMDRPALVTVLTTLLKVGLGLAALAAGWGFVGLAAVSIVTNVLTALVLLADYLRTFGAPRLAFDRGTAGWMAVASLPLMLNNLLNMAFFRLDVLLLKPLAGAVALGWYSTAYRFIDGLQIIPSSFVLAVFPLLSRHAVGDRAELSRVTGLALRVLLSLALPIAVGTTLLAEPIVLLFAGPGFLPESAQALQVLIWYLPFSVANGLLQYVLIALDRQRWIAPAFLLGVAFNVSANLLLIPSYGFLAAAVVTVLSELVLLVPFWLVARRDLPALGLLGAAWRPVIASLLMAGPVWALGGWNALVAVFVGAATYGLALLLLGGIRAEERAVVASLLRRRQSGDVPPTEPPPS